MDLQKLIRQANVVLKTRGHKADKWAIYHGESRSLANYECSECGYYAQCDSNPLPNGINIAGSAIALDCTSHEGRTKLKLRFTVMMFVVLAFVASTTQAETRAQKRDRHRQIALTLDKLSVAESNTLRLGIVIGLPDKWISSKASLIETLKAFALTMRSDSGDDSDASQWTDLQNTLIELRNDSKKFARGIPTRSTFHTYLMVEIRYYNTLISLFDKEIESKLIEQGDA